VNRTTLEEDRRVSVALGIAILVAPLVFAWFTLRPGYSYWARRFSIGYAALVLVMLIGSSAILYSMSDYMAVGQVDFDRFRVERQIEHDSRLRNSTDPNGPEGMRHYQTEQDAS
jgi:hypothetical protein